MYNGIQYKTGQQWQDGCKYNCICEDGHTGFYSCKERSVSTSIKGGLDVSVQTKLNNGQLTLTIDWYDTIIIRSFICVSY